MVSFSKKTVNLQNTKKFAELPFKFTNLILASRSLSSRDPRDPGLNRHGLLFQAGVFLSPLKETQKEKGLSLSRLKKRSVFTELNALSSVNTDSDEKKQSEYELVPTEYVLDNFQRSNQDTCLTHKPAVFEGNWVQSGDLLTDCASSVGGELSLGQNLLIAYMPWEGYNFEDAILISERLVKDDLYTSVHIERYELEMRETKLGTEEITRHIPDISEKETQNLDSLGIVKIGTWVEEGNILVGKITPINKKSISPYQKLLYTILEKQVKPFKDSSLRAPKGIKAKVIDIRYFLKNQSNFAQGYIEPPILRERESPDLLLGRTPPMIRTPDSIEVQGRVSKKTKLATLSLLQTLGKNKSTTVISKQLGSIKNKKRKLSYIEEMSSDSLRHQASRPYADRGSLESLRDSRDLGGSMSQPLDLPLKREDMGKNQSLNLYKGLCFSHLKFTFKTLTSSITKNNKTSCSPRETGAIGLSTDSEEFQEKGVSYTKVYDFLKSRFVSKRTTVLSNLELSGKRPITPVSPEKPTFLLSSNVPESQKVFGEWGSLERHMLGCVFPEREGLFKRPERHGLFTEGEPNLREREEKESPNLSNFRPSVPPSRDGLSFLGRRVIKAVSPEMRKRADRNKGNSHIKLKRSFMWSNKFLSGLLSGESLGENREPDFFSLTDGSILGKALKYRPFISPGRGNQSGNTLENSNKLRFSFLRKLNQHFSILTYEKTNKGKDCSSMERRTHTKDFNWTFEGSLTQGVPPMHNSKSYASIFQGNTYTDSVTKKITSGLRESAVLPEGGLSGYPPDVPAQEKENPLKSPFQDTREIPSEDINNNLFQILFEKERNPFMSINSTGLETSTNIQLKTSDSYGRVGLAFCQSLLARTRDPHVFSSLHVPRHPSCAPTSVRIKRHAGSDHKQVTISHTRINFLGLSAFFIPLFTKKLAHRPVSMFVPTSSFSGRQTGVQGGSLKRHPLISGFLKTAGKTPSAILPKGLPNRVDPSDIKKRLLKQNLETIHIYLAEKRKVQVGDKMAGRHGNKGIVSQILPMHDMPYLPDGTPIDMVLNPLGVPSRMNVGQIYECLLGLAGKHLGEHFKVFPFDEMYGPEASRSFVFQKLYDAREKTGFKWLFDPNSPGKIRLYDGRNGESFDQKVTVGQAYMLRLVHMVDDKIHMRSTGPYSLVTQQPLRGRSKQGGQRLGEMEVWALEGYGAAFTLLEMLTIKSDDMTGRMTLWSNLILNKDIYIGTPESFKVLVCELQALCLDIGLFRYNPVLLRNQSLSKMDSEGHQETRWKDTPLLKTPTSSSESLSRGSQPLDGEREDMREPKHLPKPYVVQERESRLMNTNSLREIDNLMNLP